MYTEKFWYSEFDTVARIQDIIRETLDSQSTCVSYQSYCSMVLLYTYIYLVPNYHVHRLNTVEFCVPKHVVLEHVVHVWSVS